MSEQNVKALRWLYGEWANGNLWALRDIADPDIEWEWSKSMASLYGGPRIYRGLEEIGAATLEWLAAWDSYWMTAEDFIDAGDQVVVLMRLHAQTADSDSVIEQRIAAVGDAQWESRAGPLLRGQGRSPRSRRSAGVGSAAHRR